MSGSGFAARRPLWQWILIGGAITWGFATLITALTDDTILVPTVLMLGSFLVPAVVVTFALAHVPKGHLTAEALFLGFLGAGTFGLVCSALTEIYLVPSIPHGSKVAVGAIEEGAKGLVLLAVGRMVQVRGVRDGMVFGATVGAGFAAFESTGYALAAMVEHADEHAILDIVETEASRAVLAPFGHIAWSALLGGALFGSTTPDGRFHLTARVGWTFAGIVLLHGTWDATYGWAITITEGLVGPGWDLSWPDTRAWVGAPDGEELQVFNVVYSLLLAVWATIGAVWVVLTWRRAGEREPTRA